MTDQQWEVRLCVVCAGNICRSPMAQAVLTHHLADAGLSDRVEVESAGTGRWHTGQRADERADAVLREHGYDLPSHQARQFEATSFDRFDLVLALDRDNLADLVRLAPDAVSRDKVQMLRAYDQAALDRHELDVPDPYYGDHTDFEHALSLIERASAGLVDALRGELGADHGGEPRRH